ncbi:hypothetical protein FVE89_24100 [Methylobacterium sp. 2A]|nr:hypothetical protein [Methylobacterium sp. 2A]
MLRFRRPFRIAGEGEMRCVRAGWIAVLAVGASPGLGAGFTGGRLTVPMRAAAQGTVTPPAGQPRVTAPGGLRGRAARRHRGIHRPRGRRSVSV